ncbi:trypsin-like peptidase domain-containing protein [Streptomyces sp. NPDC020298]|uniref:trypsin-like peptidase domain-containing protein n=1 Tax=unclassified Streptomyces TaxID=2593676 RepID=UPI0033CA3597
MAARGPRTGGGTGRDREDATQRERRRDTPGEDGYRALDARLVRIRDLAGRPRGTGFVADHQGTLVTSHEAVDGLAGLVLCTADERTRVVTADAVTPLPALALALVRTECLGVEPLPVSARDRITTGAYVRIAAGGWREARVLGAVEVTYTATDRCHPLGDALELAMGTAGRDALRPGGGAAGGPVLDPETGAVLGVLGTALRSGDREAGFAVPLRAAADARLAALLDRNAATVPAYGADLNLAGVLELTATSVGQDGPPGALAGHVGRIGATGPGTVDPVERTEVVRQLTSFAEAGGGAVLGLVGAPGSGRTTELAALAARRGRASEPAPTLWLRGADLEDADGSVADAAHRALERAARIIAASRWPLPGDCAGDDAGDPGGSAGAADQGGGGGPAGPGEATPECLARVAGRVGRPLLLLLDGPEEMPPVLAHRLPEWTAATAQWLRATGARLVVACREEYWEGAGAEFPPEALYRPAVGAAVAVPALAAPPRPLPPCVHLTDLTPDEARRARARYGVPEGALTERDARHPLTLRLLSEVRAALPPDTPATPADRHEVFSAYLDLMCLRVAVRLAAANGLRGTAVRRLAARVSRQVHEAARRSLGPGQGELDRATFESVFPWGPAPAWLGRGTGWASAVLTEGLLVPAGNGYRFAHEEFADWIQGTHLDLDEALHALVHRRRARQEPQGPQAPEITQAPQIPQIPQAPQESRPLPVPHHRVGPVVQALLLLARQHGTAELAGSLEELVHALDADPDSWWAARLLAQTLSQVPDATPYTGVLRLLADRIVARRRRHHPVSADFGPAFWTALPIPDQERFDLLRRLVQADEAPQEPAGSATPPGPPAWPGRRDDDAFAPPPASTRYLDAVARLLAAGPTAVQPHLTRWFDDERPLPATPHATVATAAQALLHTHRHGALDDLTEVLVDSAHRRGDELLTVLAEDEASAVCRAVDRWAHDERPARRAAAMAYGLRAAPHVRTEADRELLRHAALALLARPADACLHGGALALLVRDPHTRARHLPQALRQFATGDPQFPPSALVPALATDPDQVLDVFRARLRAGVGAGAVLRALADVTTPRLAGRVAALVREAAGLRPETAEPVAAFVGRRLDQGPAARAVLLPLVTGLLDGGPTPVRTALAAVLAAPGTPASRPLRRELLELLRTHVPA